VSGFGFVEATASGFPSPADDHGEARIDLNIALIPRPLSTFLMRVSDEEMRRDGIDAGDLLLIDRSVDARPGMVVVVAHGGAFLLRRLRRSGDQLWLMAHEDPGPAIPQRLDPRAVEHWGVVLHAVHSLLPRPGRRR
jgi:DNA polymerase V